jgi:hypothetical protein
MAQEIAVFVLVTLAAANLVRVWGGSFKSSSSCGKCGGCPSAQKPQKPVQSSPQLVQLEMKLKKGE